MAQFFSQDDVALFRAQVVKEVEEQHRQQLESCVKEAEEFRKAFQDVSRELCGPTLALPLTMTGAGRILQRATHPTSSRDTPGELRLLRAEYDHQVASRGAEGMETDALRQAELQDMAKTIESLKVRRETRYCVPGDASRGDSGAKLETEP